MEEQYLNVVYDVTTNGLTSSPAVILIRMTGGIDQNIIKSYIRSGLNSRQSIIDLKSIDPLTKEQYVAAGGSETPPWLSMPSDPNK